jgi:hypothetical protein
MNYDKIINIKSIKDITVNGKLKYNLNKPIDIYNNNYLFHYLVNNNNIKILDKYQYPIYNFNNDNLDGIMLAAKNNSKETLEYLLLRFPDYIYNTNKFNNNWLHYLSSPKLIKYFLFNKKFKNINWSMLLYQYNINKEAPIEYIYSINNNMIEDVVIKYFKNYKDNKVLYVLLNNTLINDTIMIRILSFMINNNVIFNKSINNSLCLNWGLLARGNKKIIDILYNYKVKTNEGYYGYFPYNGNHLLIYLLRQKEFNKKNFEYIYFKFKKFININHKNELNSFIIETLLKEHIENDRYSFRVEKDILSNMTEEEINNISIRNETILHKLVQLDYNKYYKFVKNKKLIKIRNVDNMYPIDFTTNKKWKLFLKNNKFKKVPAIKKRNDIIYATYFKSYLIDMGIHLSLLAKKYKRLYIPKPPIKTMLTDITFDANHYPSYIVETFHDFAWIIVWNNSNSYYIHPELNKLILSAYNSKKYDYAAVMMSLKIGRDGLHALPILYDFKNKKIKRWDSFGYTEYYDYMDSILSKELTKGLKFKYLGLKETQYRVGLQEQSLENIDNNIKVGDFGGFCAAWTIWFIEHHMINKSKNTKKLISKLLNHIILTSSSKLPYGKIVHYIRGYADKINTRIKNLFKNNKWNYDDYTSKERTYELDDILINYLISIL